LRLEFSSVSEPSLRSAPLEAVAEGAQRIARLALGVMTENLGNVRDPYRQMKAREFRMNSALIAAQSIMRGILSRVLRAKPTAPSESTIYRDAPNRR